MFKKNKSTRCKATCPFGDELYRCQRDEHSGSNNHRNESPTGSVYEWRGSWTHKTLESVKIDYIEHFENL